MSRLTRQSVAWLDLTCVVCLKSFKSMGRKTRWCSKECRTEERTVRKTLSTTVADRRADIALGRLEVMVTEFNRAHPERSVRLVAA